MGLNIVVLGPNYQDHRLTAHQQAMLRAATEADRLTIVDTPEAFYDALPGADVAAGHRTDDGPVAFGSLRWFHSWTAGIDHESIGPLLDADIAVTCSKGNGAVPIAEFTLMSMLMLARGADRWLDAQRRRSWERHHSLELKGRTLAIIGFGNIGMEIAQRARAFGMIVVALARRPTPERAMLVDRLAGPNELTAVFAEADYVVLATPHTPQTRHMIGAEQFRAMKPTAFFLNPSRGQLVDEKALLTTLQEGRIAGAALDAHEEEPLPPDSPFWTLPNVLVTPHNAGTTIETANRGVGVFLDNLGRFRAGLPLSNRIDHTQNY